MISSMRPHNRRLILLLAIPILLSLLSTLPARAQEKPPVSNTGNAAPPVFSLDFKDVQLRRALEQLFTGAQAQYTIAQDIPDALVTLKVRDQPLDQVLQILLRQGSSPGKRLTYTREANVYNVRLALELTVPLNWDRIAVTYARPRDIVPNLQVSFPEANFVASDQTAAILVRAMPDYLNPIRDMIRLLDIAPRSVVLRAEVVMVPGNSGSSLDSTSGKPVKPDPSRNILLASVLRTVSGQEANGEDKITGTPAQTARLQLTATPTMLGDGSYEVNTRWEVSLPLLSGKAGANGKGESLVRLEKHLSNTARFRSGETVVVGGIILSQYGLKGEILFFITLTEVTETRRPDATIP